MWHSYNRLALITLILASLVVVVPGWVVERAAAAPDAITITTLDPYKSAFTRSQRASVSVMFKNTGGTTINMSFNLSGLQVGWTGSVVSSDGVSIPSSGVPVSSNASYTAVVRVVADSGVSPGGYTTGSLKAYEVGNEAGNFATSSLQFAVPSPFVYVISDAQNLLRLSYLSPDAAMDVSELLTTGGINLAVSTARMNNNKYILGYENKLDNQSQNVEFSIFNNVGGVLKHRLKPFDHSSEPSIIDSKPAFAPSPSGKFGMAFLREIKGPPSTYQVMFQLFDENGVKVAGAPSPAQLASGNAQYDSLRLVGLPEVSTNKLMIAIWHDDLGQIWGVRLDADAGGLLSTAHIGGITNASNLVLAPLSDNRSFFAYSFNPTTMKVNYIASDSLTPGAGQQLAGTNPIPADAVQFGSNPNNILFVWREYGQAKIYYAVIDKDVSAPPSPLVLTIPDGKEPFNISVALDTQDRAMIFWTDYGIRKYLYYAVVNSSGVVVVPPMIFRDSGSGNNYYISPTAQGLTGLDGLYTQLFPVIRK